MVLAIDYENEFNELLNQGRVKGLEYNSLDSLEHLCQKSVRDDIFSRLFFDYSLNQLFLKSRVQKHLREKERFTYLDSFLKILINDDFCIFKFKNLKIEYVIVDPFLYFPEKGQTTITIDCLEELIYFKLLFDVFNKISNVRSDDDIFKIDNYIFSIARLYGFYPQALKNDNLTTTKETSTVYSKDCSGFCLETGYPIENGFFRNESAYKGFNNERSSEEAFYTDVVLFNEKIKDELATLAKNQNENNQISLSPDNNIELNVIFDLINACTKQILEKVNKSVIKYIDNNPDFGYIPSGKTIKSLLKKTIKSSYCEKYDPTSRSKDEKITVIELLAFVEDISLSDLRSFANSLPRDWHKYWLGLVDRAIENRNQCMDDKNYKQINKNRMFHVDVDVTSFNRYSSEDFIDVNKLSYFLKLCHTSTTTDSNDVVLRLILRNEIAFFKRFVEQEILESFNNLIVQKSN